MIIITIAHCAMNVVILAPALDCEEALNHRDWTKYTPYKYIIKTYSYICTLWFSMAPGKYTLSALLLAVTVALAFLARHVSIATHTVYLIYMSKSFSNVFNLNF